MPLLASTFRVRLTLIEDMLGSVPKNKDVYARFIAKEKLDKRKKEVADSEDLDALLEDEIASVPVDENRGWTGFHTDPETGDLFLYDYQIKGFIKEAGNVLKGYDEIKISALKSKIDSYVFVHPRKILLRPGVKGKPPELTSFERPLRAMTMQGPRVTLVRSDLIEAGTVIEFDIRLLKHHELTGEKLRFLFEYGEFQGLGQFRNGSFGRFTAEITEVK